MSSLCLRRDHQLTISLLHSQAPGSRQKIILVSRSCSAGVFHHDNASALQLPGRLALAVLYFSAKLKLFESTGLWSAHGQIMSFAFWFGLSAGSFWSFSGFCLPGLSLFMFGVCAVILPADVGAAGVYALELSVFVAFLT